MDAPVLVFPVSYCIGNTEGEMNPWNPRKPSAYTGESMKTLWERVHRVNRKIGNNPGNGSRHFFSGWAARTYVQWAE